MVKWLCRPPPAREPSKGSESRWQKEPKSKRPTKRSSDLPPSKRRKPKSRLPRSNDELRPQPERKDKDKGRAKRLRRDELKPTPRSLRRPPVLLSSKRPRTIRPEQKKKANLLKRSDEARKLNKTLTVKQDQNNTEKRKTKEPARKTLLNQHQLWSTELKHQPPKLRKLLPRLSQLRNRKLLRLHKEVTNLNHQPRVRRKANHEERERRSQLRPTRLSLKLQKSKRSKPQQLLPLPNLLNQQQNHTNQLIQKRKRSNTLLKPSTRSQKSQSIKPPAKK